MIIGYMVYGVAAAALIGGAALAVEHAVRLGRRAARWVWCAAIAATAAFMVAVPARASHEAYTRPLQMVTTIEPRLGAEPVAVGGAMGHRIEVSRETITLTNLGFGTALVGPHSATLEQAAGLGWLLASLGVSTLLIVVARRYSAARDQWPIADIDGITVRVTRNLGPAVLGYVRPWIAIPEWLLDRTPQEQQMIVDHEAEHMIAGDQYLLAAGWIAIALMPWNVALWWMVMRLRITIEIDCDRRMLGRGVSTHSYGMLLIDVASEYQGLALGTTAFASRPSQLERRIRAMKGASRRFARVRVVGLGLIAAGALVVAGWAPLPWGYDQHADPMRAIKNLEFVEVHAKLPSPQFSRGSRILPLGAAMELVGRAEVWKGMAAGRPIECFVGTDSLDWESRRHFAWIQRRMIPLGDHRVLVTDSAVPFPGQPSPEVGCVVWRTADAGTERR